MRFCLGLGAEATLSKLTLESWRAREDVSSGPGPWSAMVEVWAYSNQVEGCVRHDVTIWKVAGQMVTDTGNRSLGVREGFGDNIGRLDSVWDWDLRMWPSAPESRLVGTGRSAAVLLCWHGVYSPGVW